MKAIIKNKMFERVSFFDSLSSERHFSLAELKKSSDPGPVA